MLFIVAYDLSEELFFFVGHLLALEQRGVRVLDLVHAVLAVGALEEQLAGVVMIALDAR